MIKNIIRETRMIKEETEEKNSKEVQKRREKIFVEKKRK